MLQDRTVRTLCLRNFLEWKFAFQTEENIGAFSDVHYTFEIKLVSLSEILKDPSQGGGSKFVRVKARSHAYKSDILYANNIEVKETIYSVNGLN